MGFREDIVKKIEKKQVDLANLARRFECDRAATEAYIQALHDILKSLPRDTSEASPNSILRSGGAMAGTRELILAAGRPLHIGEILKGLGRNSDRKARTSVTSALGAYVRRGEVFVRTGPNTFGLLELGHKPVGQISEEPPEGFGTLSDSEMRRAS